MLNDFGQQIIYSYLIFKIRNNYLICNILHFKKHFVQKSAFSKQMSIKIPKESSSSKTSNWTSRNCRRIQQSKQVLRFNCTSWQSCYCKICSGESKRRQRFQAARVHHHQVHQSMQLWHLWLHRNPQELKREQIFFR